MQRNSVNRGCGERENVGILLGGEMLADGAEVFSFRKRDAWENGGTSGAETPRPKRFFAIQLMSPLRGSNMLYNRFSIIMSSLQDFSLGPVGKWGPSNYS